MINSQELRFFFFFFLGPAVVEEGPGCASSPALCTLYKCID